MDKEGVIKILDMGLARFFDHRQDDLTTNFSKGVVVGTADYMAPEQALNFSEVDGRADIYSLGATFYMLLSGEPPFQGDPLTAKLIAHQVKEPTPIRSLRPDVPAEMAAVVAKMMAKKPEDRYQSPGAVVEALAPWSRALSASESAINLRNVEANPFDTMTAMPPNTKTSKSLATFARLGPASIVVTSPRSPIRSLQIRAGTRPPGVTGNSCEWQRRSSSCWLACCYGTVHVRVGPEDPSPKSTSPRTRPATAGPAATAKSVAKKPAGSTAIGSGKDRIQSACSPDFGGELLWLSWARQRCTPGGNCDWIKRDVAVKKDVIIPGKPEEERLGVAYLRRPSQTGRCPPPATNKIFDAIPEGNTQTVDRAGSGILSRTGR